MGDELWALPALALVLSAGISTALIWNYVAIAHLAAAAATIEEELLENQAEVDEHKKQNVMLGRETDRLGGSVTKLSEQTGRLESAAKMFQGMAMDANAIEKKNKELNKKTVAMIEKRMEFSKDYRALVLRQKLDDLQNEQSALKDRLRDMFAQADVDNTNSITEDEFVKLIALLQSLDGIKGTGFPSLTFKDFSKPGDSTPDEIKRGELLRHLTGKKGIMGDHFKKLGKKLNEEHKANEKKIAEEEKKELASFTV